MPVLSPKARAILNEHFGKKGRKPAARRKVLKKVVEETAVPPVPDTGIAMGQRIEALVAQFVATLDQPDLVVFGQRYGRKNENPSGYSITIMRDPGKGKETMKSVLRVTWSPAQLQKHRKASTYATGVCGNLKLVLKEEANGRKENEFSETERKLQEVGEQAKEEGKPKVVASQKRKGKGKG